MNFEACGSKFSLIIPNHFLSVELLGVPRDGKVWGSWKKPDMAKSGNSRVLMYIYFSSPVFLSPHFLEKKGEGFLYCVKHQPGGIRSHSCSWHNAVLISARCPAKQGWASQGHLLCKKELHLIFPSPPQNLSFFRQCFQRGCQGWILQYLFSTLKPLLCAWAPTKFIWQRQLIHLWPNLKQDLTQCSLNTVIGPSNKRC